jgi:hypothetical protein
VVAGYKPLHYTKDGKLRDISLKGRMDRGHYLIDDAPFALRIDPKTPSYRYTKPDGTFVEVSLHVASSNSCEVKDERLYTWEKIFTDTDCVLSPITGGIYCGLILRSERAPREFKWTVTGAKSLLRPSVGFDAEGRILELVDSYDNDVLTVTWTGRAAHKRSFRKDKLKAWQGEVTYPVTIDPTVNESIADNADDKFEARVFTTSSSNIVASSLIDAYSVGMGVSLAGTVQFMFTGGFRFQTLPIPQGSVLTSAELLLDVLAVTGPLSLRVFCNDVADAAAINTSPGNIRNRTKTTAYESLTGTPSSGPSMLFPATAPLQEVIDRTDFVSSNDVMFIVQPTRNTFPFSGASSSLGVGSFIHPVLNEPRLVVEYDEGGGDQQLTVGQGLTHSVLLNPRSLVRH